MNRINYIVVILFFCLTAKAQELVPNGSFEDITACPTAQNQIYYAQPWTSPTTGTPDLYNSCNSGPLGVPSNNLGNQFARTGNGYAGCHIWGPFREYIQAPLHDTLEAGKEYCLTFYVSLPDNFPAACHNIGAYFSDSAIFLPNDTIPLPFVPQVENTAANPLISKTDWMPISGTFIAQGTETYIIIGNFRTNQNSDTTTLTPSVNNWIYYYIDDVSLVECSVPPPSNPPTEAGIVVPNVFTPNGDGINDVFSIESAGIENISCEVFDRWGIKVASITRVNEGWDGRTTSGQETIEGVYYYVVTAKGTDSKEHRKTGFIQLLR